MWMLRWAEERAIVDEIAAACCGEASAMAANELEWSDCREY